MKGLLDLHFLPVDGVELVGTCQFGKVLSGIFNESESTMPIGFLIKQKIELVYVSKLGKVGLQLIFGCILQKNRVCRTLRFHDKWVLC